MRVHSLMLCLCLMLVVNTSVYAMPKRIIFFEVLMKMVSSENILGGACVHATRCKLLFIALLVYFDTLSCVLLSLSPSCLTFNTILKIRKLVLLFFSRANLIHQHDS